MTITPFTVVRIGAQVTPADVRASGGYEISLTPGSHGRANYPGASRVMSAKFWPTNVVGNIGVAAANLLKLCLNAEGVQSTSPHQYWSCYGGWNTTETPLDPDGNSTLGTGFKVDAIGVYNGTPYSMKWGLFSTPLLDAAAMEVLPLGQILQPGATAVIEGLQTQSQYYDGTVYHRDITHGVAMANGYLHAVALNNGAACYYQSNVYYTHEGFLEVVLLQGPNTGLTIQ